MIRFYLMIWLLVLVFFSYEYWALNAQTLPSVFMILQEKGLVHFKISPEPGRPISLWLGWAGLSLMIAMNVYSMRKRFHFMNGMGKLSAWLNFHIFCGLVGPTLILFHCNFKVRGLVGISFWSMVVSFSSGIVGRYFYIQLVSKKVDFENVAESRLSQLKKGLAKLQISFNEAVAQTYIDQALVLAGASGSISNPLSTLFTAAFADIRLLFQQPATPPEWPPATKILLKQYAINKRRAESLQSFQRLMGYWHAFHFPFAVFMYLAALIHVAAALVFGI